MTKDLKKALQIQKKSTQQAELQIQGTLGIALGGQKTVDVPGRNSFVYVRLRDNQNEVVQAFNNKVAASYGLPVFVQRQNNRYEVLGVNTSRYQNNWNSYAPYLPLHGTSHSFGVGGGGDITWVYSRQFMPLLVYPSAQATGTNVFVAQHPLLDNSNIWKMVGGTGTPNFLNYIPTGGNDAIMGLVYMDVPTGNPKLLINSGTPFPSFMTGTADIYRYIPSPTDLSTQIPLAAVRISTGTSVIDWNNIYDVRQFVHPIPTGTGGGSSIDTIGFAGLYNGVPLGTGTFLNVRSPSSQAIFTISGSTFDLFVTGSASGGPPSGNAGGDLTGSYPNPSVFQAHLTPQGLTGTPVPTGTLILHAMDQQGFSFAHLKDVQGNMIEITRDNIFVVRNVSGAGMTKGQVVYITGSTGSVPEVMLAKADSLGTLGQIAVLYEDIGNNNYGRAMFSGHIEHVDLSAFANSNIVYVSATVAGGLTATQPTNPNYSQIVGIVLNNGVGNGVLQVYSRAATLTPVVTKVLVTGSIYMNYDGSQTGTGQVTLYSPVANYVQPGGRLTLVSGTPVTTADVIGATMLYYTPYINDAIELWDGSNWIPITFIQTPLALGTLTAARGYDVFGYLSSGTLAIEILAWASATARATAVTYQGGRLCKSGDKTRLLLGSFYSSSTTTTEKSAAQTFVWNMYNRVPCKMEKANGTSHNYNTATVRAFNNDQPNSSIEYFVGLVEDELFLSASGQYVRAATDGNPRMAIGINSTTVETFVFIAVTALTGRLKSGAGLATIPTLGYSYAVIQEFSTAGTAPGTTFEFCQIDGVIQA